MPIQKIPVVHKFGIISHSQRLELQERLLKQSYLQTFGTRQAHTSRNIAGVTDDFIQEYNAASSLDERERLEDQADKMLERIKRKTGLRTGGRGNHVDLPVAWTELSQLAQCKGKIQEECLDILITSLDQAPLSRNHIPALFFLAETTLYWLRTDAINQPYLRTGEIKLLKMGQLVFTRMFYHHMAGQLHGHREFKSRLYSYLDGFADSQEAYNPYPNALLSIRYINEVGKMILGDTVPDPGEIKEGDKVTDTAEGTSEMDSQMFHEVSANFETTKSSRSGAISASVHDLSPTLWHALDVWRCIHHLSGGLPDAMDALAKCGLGLASESWIDVVCALHVLADAAKSNLQVLKVMQGLARGMKPKEKPPCSPTEANTADENAVSGDGTSFPADTVSKPSTHPNTQGHLDQSPRSHAESQHGPSGTQKPDGHPMMKTPASKLYSGSTPVKSHGASRGTGFDTMGAAAEAGTDFVSGKASRASSVPTYTNAAQLDTPGLHGWHWEVAFCYVDMLADICLHGDKSTIQKMALVGNNKDVSELHLQGAAPIPIKSAGLLDLVYFKADQEADDGGSNDWSWRVRFAAIQSLVKICRSSLGDSTKEGLRTVSWNTLVKAHSLERDTRVLEALKVGQVDVNIENLINEHIISQPKAIGNKLAAGLSAIYLPPLPPPVDTTAVKKEPNTSRNMPSLKLGKPTPRRPLRTTLKEEIMLATALYEPPTDFNTRTGFDLKRIVEDQWRKQLQTQLEDEEEERLKEHEKQQKAEEERQKEVEDSRKNKLGSKYRGPAYAIEKSPLPAPSVRKKSSLTTSVKAT